MSLPLQTEKNVPLTQGATTKGRVASSPDEVKLWIAAFVLREAVLVAPEEMSDSEARYYFNGLYEYVKSVWMSTQTRVLSSKGAVPYLLSSFSSIRKPQGKATGAHLKHDFLRMFYWSEENSIFHGVPAIADDLEWPGAHDLKPIWCERIEAMNGWRAKRHEPPMYLCLASALFNTHLRFMHLSNIFHAQYRALSPPTASREKRPRAATADELVVHVSGSGSGSGLSTQGSMSTAPSHAESSAQLEPTEPPFKRIRTDVEDADDVEMTDVSGGEALANISEPRVDRKGKGRAKDPVPEVTSADTPTDEAAESESQSQITDTNTENVDLAEFMDQDVMFQAALEEQLSPIPCKGCANGGHDCFVALKHFHGCWRCKASSNGCSLVPKGEPSAKGELKNMKGPQHWPWYITLVFHVLNVLALDTEAGPQYLPSEYLDIELPDFPTEKVTNVMTPYTTNQVKEMAREKKALKADVYYALPRSLSKVLESKRTDSPLWPMVPKNAKSRYEDIIRRARLGTLTRSWAADEVPERGRARSRVSTKTTPAKPPQQQERSTRASSKVSSRGSEAPPTKPKSSEVHSVVTKASGSGIPASRADTQVQTPSRPRPKPRAASKARAASRPPPSQAKKMSKATSSKLVKEPAHMRATALRSKSVKVNPENEDSSPAPERSRRSYVGKRSPQVMKRVPAYTDDEEETLTVFEEKRDQSREKYLVATVQPGGEVHLDAISPTHIRGHPGGPSGTDPYVTPDILSAGFESQKDTFFDALKNTEEKILSGFQEGITHAINNMQPHMTSSTQQFATGINRELDHRLSGYLQGIERHLDSKIDEKVASLTGYLERRMDDLLAKHRKETREILMDLFGKGIREEAKGEQTETHDDMDDQMEDVEEAPATHQTDNIEEENHPEPSGNDTTAVVAEGDQSSIVVDTEMLPPEVDHSSADTDPDDSIVPSTDTKPDGVIVPLTDNTSAPPQSAELLTAHQPDRLNVSGDADIPHVDSTDISTAIDHNSDETPEEQSATVKEDVCLNETSEGPVSQIIDDQVDPIPTGVSLPLNPDQVDNEQVVYPDTSTIDPKHATPDDGTDADPQIDADADAEGEHDMASEEYGEKMSQD